MKKLIVTILLLAVIGLLYANYEKIINFSMYNIVYRKDFIREEPNQYKRNNDWLFVQKTDDFKPENKQDILNIFYTGLNNGWDEFTFFCPKEYKNCKSDVEDITDNSTLLSNINNYISTFNSYNVINVNINSFGRINVKVDKLYDNNSINEITNKIDQIYNEITTEEMSNYDKIKVFHNYIINRTTYDEERSNQIKQGEVTSLKHPSNIAYGPLFLGKAICGGYTDVMALYLDKLGLPNYKISSAKHIWNFVYIDGVWKHLDLTWDDPVLSNGEKTLTYTFFLISSNDLKAKNDGQHNYDTNVFIEAK